MPSPFPRSPVFRECSWKKTQIKKKKKKIAGERYSVKENCNNRLLFRRMGGKLIRKTTYVSFFKELSKKSEISNLQLQRSWHYEFKICKGYFNVIRNYLYFPICCAVLLEHFNCIHWLFKTLVGFTAIETH